MSSPYLLHKINNYYLLDINIKSAAEPHEKYDSYWTSLQDECILHGNKTLQYLVRVISCVLNSVQHSTDYARVAGCSPSP